MSLKKILLPLFVLSNFILYSQEESLNSISDSLSFYTSLAEDDKLDLNYRIKNVKKAIQIANISKQDTSILKTKRLLATLYLNKIASNEMATDSIYKLNHQNLILAKKTLRLIKVRLLHLLGKLN